MKIQELSKNLKIAVKPFYMITGDDFYFKKMATDQLKNLVDESSFDFNITYFNPQMSAESLYINLQTPPLMSDYRIVMFTCDGKKIDKDRAKQLEEKIKEWLKNPCPGVVLVAVNDEDSLKFLTKIAEVVDCSKQNTIELMSPVTKYINENGYSSNDTAVKELITKCNNDMMIITNELVKLFALSENKIIDYDMVCKIVVNNIEQSVFKLTDSIAQGNIGDAYFITDNLLATGEQPLKILAAITSQYRRMFISKVSVDSDNVIAEQLGVKLYAISIAKRTAKNYKPMQLKRLVDKMQLIEFQAKNGEIGMLEGLNLALMYAVNRR